MTISDLIVAICGYEADLATCTTEYALVVQDLEVAGFPTDSIQSLLQETYDALESIADPQHYNPNTEPPLGPEGGNTGTF